MAGMSESLRRLKENGPETLETFVDSLYDGQNAREMPSPLTFDTRIEWLKERQKSLGSSDWAAIFGVDPYRGPLSVYASKVGEVKDDEGTIAMRIGHYVEQGIIAFVLQTFGLQVDRLDHPLAAPSQWTLYRNSDQWLHSCPDAIAHEPHPPEHPFWVVPVEVKNRSYRDRERWEHGPPADVLLQCQAHLHVLGLERCAVGVFWGGNTAEAYWVERHPSLPQLVERARQWWGRHVVAENPPPPDSHLDLDAAKELGAHLEDACIALTDADEQHVEGWLAAKEMRLAMDKAAKGHEAYLRWRLKDDDRGILKDGRTISRDGRNVLRCKQSE